MIPSWNEETIVRIIARYGLALLVLFVLFVLSTVPFETIHFGEIRPLFFLIAIYYLSILQPSLLPVLFVFFIGFGLDILSVYPLGLNALVFVIVQWVTKKQRIFLLGQSFIVVWTGFAILALGACLIQWLLFSLFYLNLVSIKSIVISTLFSIILFPLVVFPLSKVQKALSSDIS